MIEDISSVDLEYMINSSVEEGNQKHVAGVSNLRALMNKDISRVALE